MVLVHALSILAFMVVSFAMQAASHFVVNQEHFASIDHIRSEPIMPMGLAAMVIQGLLMSVALRSWRTDTVTILDGVIVALVFGAFLLAYISLVEPAKYTVPDVLAWVRVETAVGGLQFLIFGVALGAIHSQLFPKITEATQ